MNIQNAEHAIVEIGKLRDYCLSETHPRGKHKAIVFASVLGITTTEAEYLRNAILSAILDNEVHPSEQDEYGQRYFMDFDMENKGRKAIVRTSWIIRTGEDFPRLTSCYIL